MHARTEQLLSLRDGEPVDALVARHVAECPSCLRELERLRQMQARLRTLASLPAPSSAWSSIQAKVEGPAEDGRLSYRQRLVVPAAAAAFVAVVLLVALRFIDTERGASSAKATSTVAPSALVEAPPLSAATVEQLVEQSQQLEYVLRHLPQPSVERVAFAATTDIIEERIQWLDMQLSLDPEQPRSSEETRQLWHERVDLMDSLVKVRYAQVQGLGF